MSNTDDILARIESRALEIADSRWNEYLKNQ